ncbi:hypothetical protein [Microcoleus sp. Pol12B5]|uniref:hypothetical protein n=1 Tax=Microcoleus sp. Pol12B5 TaxID=3055396 RepID=UPI002FD12450
MSKGLDALILWSCSELPWRLIDLLTTYFPNKLKRMDKILLETDLFDRLEKASKFLSSLLTTKPVADRQSSKDISRLRFATKDISVRRKPSEIAKIKNAQPVIDKLEQDLTKELVSYFE